MAHNPQTLAEYEPSAECSLAGEYSALWRANSAPPDLDSFLRLRPDVSREQRARLVLLDQARSWSTGEGRTVEDYLRVCPRLAENQGPLLKLIVSEYVLQEHPPAVTEFLDRFPQLKAELLDQLCCSGEMALLTDEPRSASIEARGPINVLVLPAKTFHEYATQNPEISQVLTQMLAERLGGDRRDVLVGKTLDRYRIIRLNGPLNQENFRKAFGQLASAVLYAHQRGVIHRDIKPT